MIHGVTFINFVFLFAWACSGLLILFLAIE